MSNFTASFLDLGSIYTTKAYILQLLHDGPCSQQRTSKSTPLIYMCILAPNGHGAMLDLPESDSVRSVLDWALENDKIMISLCHDPAAFLAAGYGREHNPFSGYTMCVFPDDLDSGANIEIGYLPGKMPWALGEALKAEGINIVNDTMSGATYRDRNLLTGDSPLASNALGKLSVEALLEKVNA